MSSQMTVIIAGIVLVVAIVVALVIMRRGDSRFTYDTQHGTAPRATEGEGNTAATAFKGRFSILTAGVGAMFAALAVKLWGMQMVSSDYYDKQAKSNQTRQDRRRQRMTKNGHHKARLQTHKQQDNAVDHVDGKREGAHGNAARGRRTARLTGGAVHQGKAAHRQQQRHNTHRHGGGKVIEQAAAKTADDGSRGIAREHAQTYQDDHKVDATARNGDLRRQARLQEHADNGGNDKRAGACPLLV